MNKSLSIDINAGKSSNEIPRHKCQNFHFVFSYFNTIVFKSRTFQIDLNQTCSSKDYYVNSIFRFL